MVAFTEAVLDMIDAPRPKLPKIVEMVRLLRKHKATLSDEPRDISNG